jgi:hypothetical protein
MRVVLDVVVTLLAIGLVLVTIVTLNSRWPFADTDLGEMRCEGDGAVIVKVAGKDYAVNGMASSRYPSIQQIWNNDTYPNTNINRLITRGLTLCDW